MADMIASAKEEAARKRKEKILQLRKKAEDSNQTSTDETGETEQDDQPAPKKKPLKFRSYVPKDETLKEKKVEDAKPLSVKESVKEHLEKSKPEAIIDEVDIANLAPRKPDWDLKRDVAKKLEKLQRRTQRAIVELIKERLSEGDEDLASAVNAATDLAE
ncbi:coiled-coil domain-containing protein 12-like [Rhopilema esculentum]|uniref:coiled-coil domain-containing protein 12-like n=1 Tax=Rhopilema esculentum TaxID=499914 RepID=UPI0031DAE660